MTNESSTASITKIEVRFPGDVRIAEIYPIAVADWAPSITMTKVDNNPANDVPSAVVWITMPGKEIKPGATSLLPLAMGPMPDAEFVYLDVIQTRSDGSTETWAGVDVPAAGAQHPAFALKLVPLEPGQVPEDHGHGAGSHGRGADRCGRRSGGRGAGQPPKAPTTVRLAVVLLLIAALTGFALYWQRRRGARSADERPSRDGRRGRSGGPGSRPAREGRTAEDGRSRHEGVGSGQGHRSEGHGGARRRGRRARDPWCSAARWCGPPRRKRPRTAADGRPEINRRRGHRHHRAPAWKRVETSRRYRGR